MSYKNFHFLFFLFYWDVKQPDSWSQMRYLSLGVNSQSSREALIQSVIDTDWTDVENNVMWNVKIRFCAINGGAHLSWTSEAVYSCGESPTCEVGSSDEGMEASINERQREGLGLQTLDWKEKHHKLTSHDSQQNK